MRTRWFVPILVVALALLSACGKDIEFQPDRSGPGGFRLEASIPADGSAGAALTSKVVFHFNETVDIAALQDGDATWVRVDEAGQETPVVFTIGAAGPNVILTPADSLDPNSVYKAAVTTRVRDENGNAPSGFETPYTIQFRTRWGRSLAGVPPSVTALVPGPADPVYDWSTFHVYFSEPISPSIRYGEAISLKREGSDSLVPAQMFVSGGLVTIDPASDMEPGRRYTLSVSGDLRDEGGERKDLAESFTFDILDSSPRATLVVEQCPTLTEGSSCEPKTDRAQMDASAYTGDTVNAMVIDSTLLGHVEAYLAGQLRVEMGSTTLDPTKIPVVIRRGQKLHASSLEALFGGEIPSGLETGPITLTVLTDAFGFMESNDQTFGVEGSKVGLTFILDAGVTTDNSTANAQMGQALLGIQLAGDATVVDGLLKMEVAGFDTVDIFGETMDVSVALALQPPVGDYELASDQKAPAIVSSSPRPYDEDVRLDSAIRLYFDEPVITEESGDAVVVSDKETGERVEGETVINGPKLVFRPSWPLDPLTEYEVRVDGSVSDLSRNRIGRSRFFHFTTGAAQASAVPPRLGATDPARNSLAEFPAQLPIQLYFTQLMDPSSIVLGESFTVRDLTDAVEVPGTLKTDWTSLTFTPNEAFREGHVYEWRVSERVSNIADIALDVDEDGTPGGSPAVGAIASTFRVDSNDRGVVRLIFDLLPAADSDVSGFVDGGEVPTDRNFFKVNLFGLFKDPSYATGVMIGHVRPLNPDVSPATLPITLTDGLRIFSTSTGIDLGTKDDVGLLDTGPITIGAEDPGSADVTEGVTGSPQMNVDMNLLFAVSNDFMAGLIDPAVQLKAKGDIAFGQDGRIIADIKGSTSIRLSIPLTSIEVPLPTSMNLRAVSPAP